MNTRKPFPISFPFPPDSGHCYEFGIYYVFLYCSRYLCIHQPDMVLFPHVLNMLCNTEQLLSLLLFKLWFWDLSVKIHITLGCFNCCIIFHCMIILEYIYLFYCWLALGFTIFCVCHFRAVNSFELVSLCVYLKFLCGIYLKGKSPDQRKWASLTPNILPGCSPKQLSQFAFQPAVFGSSSCSTCLQTPNIVRIDVFVASLMAVKWYLPGLKLAPSCVLVG